jgi:hypothetical protein
MPSGTSTVVRTLRIWKPPASIWPPISGSGTYLSPSARDTPWVAAPAAVGYAATAVAERDALMGDGGCRCGLTMAPSPMTRNTQDGVLPPRARPSVAGATVKPMTSTLLRDSALHAAVKLIDDAATPNR